MASDLPHGAYRVMYQDDQSAADEQYDIDNLDLEEGEEPPDEFSRGDYLNDLAEGRDL